MRSVGVLGSVSFVLELTEKVCIGFAFMGVDTFSKLICHIISNLEQLHEIPGFDRALITSEPCPTCS